MQEPDVGQPETPVTDATPDPPAETSSRGRRVGLVVVVVAVVGAMVAAGLARTPPGEPLLGTPAGASGKSATGPPPDGLRLAWRQELGGDGQFGFRSAGPVEVAADEDRVAVDGRVVDRRTGRLLRLDPASFGGGQLLFEDVVLRTDPLTGDQEQVATLPPTGDVWLAAVVGDVVVLNGHAAGDEPNVVLRQSGGSEIATVAGTLYGFYDRAEDDPALLPVRADDGGPSTPVRLVDPTDGRIVRTLEAAGGTQVVDVVGPTVVHATTSARVGGPGPGVEWTVQVLDPTTGDVVAQGEVTSAQAPRLLGVHGDGGIVVATRSGRTVTVWELRAGSLARPFVTASATGGTFDDPAGHHDGSITGQAALVGDLVVVVDGEVDGVRGVDMAGRELWRAPAVGDHRIGTGDGLVALVPQDPTAEVDRGTRVLDAADGSPVVVVPPGLDPYGQQRRPAVAYDGHVAIGEVQGPFGGGGHGLRLGATRWFDLRDGSTTFSDDVLAPFLPEGESIGLSWRLHGLTRAPDGGVDPVITRDLESDTVQLLKPGDGFDAIDLDPLGQRGVVGYFAQVVGFSPTHLLVQRQDFETGRSTTHVVDRATGATAHLEGVSALGLFGDIALGIPDFGFDGSAAVTAVGTDVTDGSERWRIEDARPLLFGEHRVADAEALVSVSRRGAVLVDLGDGTTRWRHVVTEVLWSNSAVLGDDHLVVVTTDGQVLALDRADGAEAWRTDVGTPITTLTGAGDHVLVGTVDGLVVHLDGEGEEVQRVAVGPVPVTSVAALGDTVVVVVGDAVIGLRADGDGIVEQDQVDLP